MAIFCDARMRFGLRLGQIMVDTNLLKFTLQIANTQKPHSEHNTLEIALASVRDSNINIAMFLEGGFGDELAALHSHMW